MSEQSPETAEAPEPQRRGGPIAWSVRNPIAANLLMVILLAAGLWTALTIQKEVFPQFQLCIVEVSVTYPGASPEEVEQGILLPVEEAVQGVQGIGEMTSTAEEGTGRVTLELVSGADRMKAFQDIDQAVSRIRTFPDDIEEPEVRLQSRQREVMEIGLYGGQDIWSLRKLAERARDQLLANPDITQVELGNVPEYVTHVEIPRARLREYGLTLDDLRGRWTLVHLVSARCDEACRERIYYTRQIRAALGQDIPRVRRLVLAADGRGTRGLAGILHQHPQLTVVAAGSDASLVRQFPGPIAPATVFLVDPLGNLMMRFGPDVEADGILEDLEKLLKLSRIG